MGGDYNNFTWIWASIFLLCVVPNEKKPPQKNKGVWLQVDRNKRDQHYCSLGVSSSAKHDKQKWSQNSRLATIAFSSWRKNDGQHNFPLDLTKQRAADSAWRSATFVFALSTLWSDGKFNPSLHSKLDYRSRFSCLSDCRCATIPFGLLRAAMEYLNHEPATLQWRMQILHLLAMFVLYQTTKLPRRHVPANTFNSDSGCWHGKQNSDARGSRTNVEENVYLAQKESWKTVANATTVSENMESEKLQIGSRLEITSHISTEHRKVSQMKNEKKKKGGGQQLKVHIGNET